MLLLSIIPNKQPTKHLKIFLTTIEATQASKQALVRTLENFFCHLTSLLPKNVKLIFKSTYFLSIFAKLCFLFIFNKTYFHKTYICLWESKIIVKTFQPTSELLLTQSCVYILWISLLTKNESNNKKKLTKSLFKMIPYLRFQKMKKISEWDIDALDASKNFLYDTIEATKHQIDSNS